MRNFKGNFETRKRSFICAFLICMTVPLNDCYGVVDENLLVIRQKSVCLHIRRSERFIFRKTWRALFFL